MILVSYLVPGCFSPAFAPFTRQELENENKILQGKLDSMDGVTHEQRVHWETGTP